MRVILRDWHPGDEEAAVRWSRDREFCRANEWTLDLPAEEVRQWWQERARNATHLKIIEVDGVAAGYAEWQGLQADTAELGIAIGNSRAWGRGIGAQAGRLMLEWAFGPLHLPRVWAEVHAPNTRSLALMHRLGFREAGREESADYQGQAVPMVRFDLTREEFRRG